MSLLASSLLAQTIDDHIAWMAAWTRCAIFAVKDRADKAEEIPAPESFALWRAEAQKTLEDKPTLDKLLGHYDQLHRFAKLVLIKTPEGEALSVHDYDAVAIKFQELITGMRRLERALASAEAGLDNLTGLRSRAGMRDDLTRELSRFARNGKPFCLAMMDIDHFKTVNDTYGHENGDKVLAAVANFICRSLRPFDDAWRWGGEELLLCLKEADIAGGKIALERVRKSLEKLPIKLIDGTTVTVTASFGLAAAHAELTLDALLEKADKALYRAKEGGRNRVESAE